MRTGERVEPCEIGIGGRVHKTPAPSRSPGPPGRATVVAWRAALTRQSTNAPPIKITAAATPPAVAGMETDGGWETAGAGGNSCSHGEEAVEGLVDAEGLGALVEVCESVGRAEGLTEVELEVPVSVAVLDAEAPWDIVALVDCRRVIVALGVGTVSAGGASTVRTADDVINVDALNTRHDCSPAGSVMFPPGGTGSPRAAAAREADTLDRGRKANRGAVASGAPSDNDQSPLSTSSQSTWVKPPATLRDHTTL